MNGDHESIKRDRLLFAITGVIVGISLCMGGWMAESQPIWYTGFTIKGVALYLLLRDM